MGLSEERIFVWLSQFAYEPTTVYATLVSMMLLSAFGLPIPEEVTLLSIGLLAYMGANPALYPPPFLGAPVIQPIEAALVATLAVFGADFLVYWIGRVFGRKLIHHPRLSHIFSTKLIEKAESFTKKYGMLATGIFRFTPGVRFPGHILCGMMRMPAWKFALVDGFAVAISVPTQILLIAHYGEAILGVLKEFKIVVLCVIGIAIVAVIALRMRERARERQEPTPPPV